MFATDPRIFGRSGDIVLGKKSGKASVEYFLEQMKLNASDAEVATILEKVKAKGTEKRGILTQEEFRLIVESNKLES